MTSRTDTRRLTNDIATPLYGVRAASRSLCLEQQVRRDARLTEIAAGVSMEKRGNQLGSSPRVSMTERMSELAINLHT